jgi:hypothetical protein
MAAYYCKGSFLAKKEATLLTKGNLGLQKLTCG